MVRPGGGLGISRPVLVEVVSALSLQLMYLSLLVVDCCFAVGCRLGHAPSGHAPFLTPHPSPPLASSGGALAALQLVVVGDVEVQGLEYSGVAKLLDPSQLPLQLQFLRIEKLPATVRVARQDEWWTDGWVVVVGG